MVALRRQLKGCGRGSKLPRARKRLRSGGLRALPYPKRLQAWQVKQSALQFAYEVIEMEKSMTLNLRVNPVVKQQAEDVLKQPGIPMATAIDMYL